MSQSCFAKRTANSLNSLFTNSLTLTPLKSFKNPQLDKCHIPRIHLHKKIGMSKGQNKEKQNRNSYGDRCSRLASLGDVGDPAFRWLTKADVLKRGYVPLSSQSDPKRREEQVLGVCLRYNTWQQKKREWITRLYSIIYGDFLTCGDYIYIRVFFFGVEISLVVFWDKILNSRRKKIYYKTTRWWGV